jgi:hypothetical protein
MKKVTKWFVWAAAAPALQLAFTLPSPAHSSQIQMISGHCERSAVFRLPCLPPIEYSWPSPDSFAVWADSGGVDRVYDCNPPGSGAEAWLLGVTAIFADSIYFKQECSVDAGNVLTADGRVDAQVRFRVPAGQEFRYVYGGTLEAADFGAVGCSGLASVALSRVDPGGTTKIYSDSVKVVLLAGHYPEVYDLPLSRAGTLTSGDYLFEAHTRAHVVNIGHPSAHLWIRFRQYPKPTAVEPRSWGSLKALYR